MKYWIGVVSKEHALIGINGSFAQVCHGKQGPLKRMQPGDGFLIYAPKDKMGGTVSLQTFVGIGYVTTGNVYQFDMGGGFKPYRIDIGFQSCKEAPIRPLLDKLSFTKGTKNWGMKFRFGHFEIPEADFKLIQEQMAPKLEADKVKKNKLATVDSEATSIHEHKNEDKAENKDEATSYSSQYSQNGLLKKPKLIINNTSTATLPTTRRPQ